VSDLNVNAKRKIEKLLEMGSGYVLGACFSNASFQGFVLDITEKDIYDNAYARGSGSKANVLRGFWTVEPNHVVGKLLAALLDVVRKTGRTREDDPLFRDCERIVQYEWLVGSGLCYTLVPPTICWSQPCVHYSFPSAASTAFRPRAIMPARVTPMFFARASDRASRLLSTVTEITFAPSP
jgi:hypothetical protein